MSTQSRGCMLTCLRTVMDNIFSTAMDNSSIHSIIVSAFPCYVLFEVIIGVQLSPLVSKVYAWLQESM